MKNFFYTILVIAITLVAAEFVLRFVIDLPDPYANLRRKAYSTGSVIRLQNTRNTDLLFVFNPNELFPKTERNKVKVHINNFGFRHKDDNNTLKAKEVYDIFAIGGSTTQCYDFEYTKTWCQILEQDLERELSKPVNVYNGGTAGAVMFDHIALLQNRVIHLDPDMVILFAGVNDLNLLLGDDNLYRFDDIYETNFNISWYRLGLARLTLYKLFLNAKQKMVADEDHPLKRRADEHDLDIPVGTPIQFSDHVNPPKETKALPLGKNPEINFAYYQHMMKSFIGTCKANDIPLVVMTQPTTWLSEDQRLQDYHWMNKNKENRFAKDFMQASMDKMNSDVEAICHANEVAVLSLDKNIENTGDYFYDDCHFTPKGSKHVGKVVSKFLLSNNLIQID
ncbi:SGNH/GDSL hydrolase family protein [Marinilongibacter aquaticus]|uniref:SGNH/GDSL hydrolase family protein n=1 Tax=Marinilongibacter aquaticus TaxID=2975157 RepID=UPI0021BD98A3|nr:SGNH/GDSL hydrolase family protein [Marinilongibacter aquaticus]UBM60340.1 SGNH/GDSL hydrolase family protein [Marinilongibacter aquaticus]